MGLKGDIEALAGARRALKKIIILPFKTAIFKPVSVKWESSGILSPVTRASVKYGKIGPRMALNKLLSVSAIVQIIVAKNIVNKLNFNKD